jgi:hypothetical protein
MNNSHKGRKTCVFCGHPVNDPATERKRAREHVYPNWALERYGIKKHVIEFTPYELIRNDGISLQLTVPDQDHKRKLTLDNFLLGNVCNKCNNGWMSRLEGNVRKEMESLIAGDQVRMVNMPNLAKWAMKTAFVMSAYQDPPTCRIPPGHGRMLVGDKVKLPKDVSVFFKRSEEFRIWFSIWSSTNIGMKSGVEQKANDVPPEVKMAWQNSYRYLIQFGHAQFVVQYFPYPATTTFYNPKECICLAATSQVKADETATHVPETIGDPDFRFMMSFYFEVCESSAPMGPNELCRCGSGFKFKYCHGNRIGRPFPQQRDDNHATGGWTGEFYRFIPRE